MKNTTYRITVDLDPTEYAMLEALTTRWYQTKAGAIRDMIYNDFKDSYPDEEKREEMLKAFDPRVELDEILKAFDPRVELHTETHEENDDDAEN